MAGFVPDASLTLTWCFEDEATPKTDALLHRLKAAEEAVVPAHWPVEVTNALLMAIRRQRITEGKAQRFVQDLSALPIRLDPANAAHTFNRVFALGQQYRLTSYDAAYLEVAIRAGLPLATLDDDLRKAAIAAGVALSEAL